MRAFFTMVGFVGVLLASGAISFMGIGYIRNADKNGVASASMEEESANTFDLEAPAAISHSSETRESKRHEDREQIAALSAPPVHRKRKEKQEETRVSAVESTRAKLKMLYSDERYVEDCISEWKSEVKDLSERYALKPEVAMAMVIVENYLDKDYSYSDLKRDAREHANERLMATEDLLDKYQFGWSINKLISQYELEDRMGATKVSRPVVAKKDRKERVVVAKTTSSKKEKSAAPQVKSSSLETALQKQVAQSMGYRTWEGLQRLANHEERQKAEKMVRTMMTTSRIR